MMEDFLLSLNPFLFAIMEFALGLMKNDDEELMSFCWCQQQQQYQRSESSDDADDDEEVEGGKGKMMNFFLNIKREI